MVLVAGPAQALKPVTSGGGVGIAVPGPGGVNEGGNAILTGINKIFVTTNDNQIYRFDGATEAIDSSFSISTPGIMANRLYADQTHNLIYATDNTGASITAYDGTTGALTRTLARAGSDFYNRVVIDEANNRVWAAGTVSGNAAGDRSLTAFDSSGAVVFRDDVPTAYSGIYGSPNMAVDQSNGNVFFAYPSSTTLYRIDGTTLAKTAVGTLWSQQAVSSMAIDSSLHKLLVSYNDGTVGVFDSTSGAFLTTFTHGGGGTAYVDSVNHVMYTTGNNLQGYSTVDGSTNTIFPAYKTAVQLSVDPGRQQVWFADTGTRTAGTSMYLRLAQNEPRITSTVAPGATRGAAYSYQLTASGTPTFTYSVTLGTLPAGVSLNANTGLISGTPTGTITNPYNIQVTATNRAGTGNQTLTINVAYPPTVTTQPSNVTVAPGAPLTLTTAANGYPTPTVQWQQSADGGATWTAIAGATSSTYTTTMTSGMNGYRYRSVYTNSVSTATSNASQVTLMTVPVITPGPPSTVIGTGVSYYNSFSATGGGTMAYAITSGSLPPGLALNSATGLLSGTPTTPGTYPLGITATNAAGASSAAFTVIVQTPTAPSFAGVPTALNAVQGAAYGGSATVSAGTNVTYSLFSGSLPAGLTLYTGTGGIVGTPTSTGSTFTIRATNGVASVNQTFTITVTVPPSFTSTAPTSAIMGTPFSSTPTTLGTGPLTFAVTAGALPAGVTVNTATGVISGTPTASGTFAFTLTATGPGGSASQSISLQVNRPPSYVGVSPPAANTVGQPYTSSVAAPIGAGVTYAVTTGSLPAGLTLDAATGAITGSTTAEGSTSFTVTATNAYGTATHGFTVVATAAPVVQTPTVAPPAPTSTPTATSTPAPNSTSIPSSSSSSAPAPSPTATATSTPTSTPALRTTPTPSPSSVPAPAVAIDMRVAVGAAAEGAPVAADASGLQPGSGWTLTMHSTPVVIATGVVPASGSIARSLQLPATIPVGSHTLIFTATSMTGTPIVRRTWFAVSAAKTVAGISTVKPVTLPATQNPDAGVDTSSGWLASTGFAAMPWVGGASALLILGAGILLFGRRRKSGADTDRLG